MKTIFNTLVHLMNLAEEMKDLKGDQKKAFVLTEIQQIITQEAYERYGMFIEFTIDGLIEISRKNLKLFVHKKNLCFSCIKNNL